MPFNKECTSNFHYSKERMKHCTKFRQKNYKSQCFCGVKVVSVQVPTAYLAPVTMAPKCFLILFINHPKWLQHWDHAETGLEKVQGSLWGFVIFLFGCSFLGGFLRKVVYFIALRLF